MSKKAHKVVDLFPYKIKNREKFYDRDHPKRISRDSETYKKYWGRQLKTFIEGRWVDDDGTWVYMIPKLCYYINYSKIYDAETGQLIQPNLRDIEWIWHTYLFCCQGFSGFEQDSEYTCNFLVEKIESGKELDDVEQSKLTEHVYKEDGTYKKFVNPWEYLTRHYLIDKPVVKPLGLPLYENSIFNAFMFSARGLGKSLQVFNGDLPHEFSFNGITRIDDLDGILSKAYNFFVGAADQDKLQRSMEYFRKFYFNMPGSYGYGDERNGGPFYKNLSGSWNAGQKPLQHVIFDTKRKPKYIGSKIIHKPITKANPNVGAGGRMKRIYIEEVGLVDNLDRVHSINADSLKVSGKKVGMQVCIGTGGSVDKIKDCKKLFNNPRAYNFFPIPNYWENPEKEIGLFIPVYYKYDEYRDENGNTDIEAANSKVERVREVEKKKTMEAYNIEVMNNPKVPSEIFSAKTGSLLPNQEASRRLAYLETNDVFKKLAIVGELEYHESSPYGVRFNKDLTGDIKPIIEYGVDFDKIDKKGGFVMYESPPEYIPEGLYKVILDPVTQDKGSSLNSVLVYKGFSHGDGSSLYDTIVAEWLGRFDVVEQNWEMAIKIARFFNAKIFAETNAPGFFHYCRQKGYLHLLEESATQIEKEILKYIIQKGERFGFRMNSSMKFQMTLQLASWLMTEREPENGAVGFTRTLDHIYSPMVLSEIANYNDEGNFDHISSLRGLMLWLMKDKRKVYEIKEKPREEVEYSVAIPSVIQRPKILRI